VNNADDTERLRTPVDDEIGIECPEQNVAAREILALMTHAGDFGKTLKCAVELLD
jgi:hypothetical protein